MSFTRSPDFAGKVIYSIILVIMSLISALYATRQTYDLLSGKMHRLAYMMFPTVPLLAQAVTLCLIIAWVGFIVMAGNTLLRLWKKRKTR